MEEIGQGLGEGRNVNIAWKEAQLGNTDYLAEFELLLLPSIRAHDPGIVFVSAGFDAADGDAQGNMRITLTGFAALTTQLKALGFPILLVYSTLLVYSIQVYCITRVQEYYTLYSTRYSCTCTTCTLV